MLRLNLYLIQCYSCILKQAYDGSNYLPISETLLGIACSFLYFRTGRLLAPIAFHSSNNIFYVLAQAIDGTSKKKFAQWYYAKYPESSSIPPPELTFWERFICKDYNHQFIRSSIEVILSLPIFQDMASNPSFLPTMFSDEFQQTQTSSDSIFQSLPAPLLRNKDATITKFADHLIRLKLSYLFGNNESIPIDRLIHFSIVETHFKYVLHLLADARTPPELRKILLNSSVYELVKWIPDDEHMKLIIDKWKYDAGCMLMDYPSGVVSCSQFENDLIFGLGLSVSETNRDLFITYCLVRGIHEKDKKLTIPDLLKEYCDLEQKILAHEAKRNGISTTSNSL